MTLRAAEPSSNRATGTHLAVEIAGPRSARADHSEDYDVNEEAKELALQTENLVAIVWDKLEGWLTGFVEMLPNLVVAMVVVALAALAARLFAGARPVRPATLRSCRFSRMLTRLGTVGVGIFIALGVLQLDKTVTSLLAGIGVVGLALGFAFQDIASNFMSGVIMAIREPMSVGDTVETHGTMGTVERVTLRATVIRNFAGQLVMIPNKDVLQSPITNYSQSGKRRVEVPVGVSYADDLSAASEAACAAIEASPTATPTSRSRSSTPDSAKARSI